MELVSSILKPDPVRRAPASRDFVCAAGRHRSGRLRAAPKGSNISRANPAVWSTVEFVNGWLNLPGETSGRDPAPMWILAVIAGERQRFARRGAAVPILNGQ
jgi:hypothetical protein